MHRTLFIVLLFILASVKLSFAQRVNGRFVTSFYAWQRADTVGAEHTHAFGYQTAQFDFYQKNLSLHAYLQGFDDLGFSIVGAPRVTSGTGLRLYNLYLTVHDSAKTRETSFGRQTVFAGVGSGTIDGVRGRFELASGKATLIGYAGAIPPPSQKLTLIGDVGKNYMIGGQVIALPFTGARFGLSYMKRLVKQPSYDGLRLDSQENVFKTVINPEPYSEEFVGVDVSYRGSKRASFYGRYEYDLNFDRISRGQVFSRVSIIDRLAVTGEYIYRSPRIPFHSFFSIFPKNSVKELEGGVEYNVHPLWRAFGRVAKVWYIDDDTRRYSAGISGEYGIVGYSGSVGYAGKLNSVAAQFYYPLLDRSFTPSLGLSYAEYRLSWSAPVEHVVAGIIGSAVRPLRHVSFDFQLQWLNNRITKHDVRLLGQMNVWFTD